MVSRLWLASQHRAERLTAEDVDVEVRHLLSGPLSGVGKQPVALDDELLVAGDLADRAGDALEEKSSQETYGPLGITRIWTGASGLMSWKARACSSSYTVLEGSSPRRIFAKTLLSS
jgi:hypothetical protein